MRAQVGISSYQHPAEQAIYMPDVRALKLSPSTTGGARPDGPLFASADLLCSGDPSGAGSNDHGVYYLYIPTSLANH
jgi:hypothetical protein